MFRRIPVVLYFFTIFAVPSVALASPPAQSERAVFPRGILPKKDLKRPLLGINAFVNDQRFGSISQQFREVRNVIKLKRVRILFAWNDDVQPTAGGAINFSFYDEIARSLPPQMEALVILTGVPSWMNNSANWIDGDPRKTFVELWVKPVVSRYKKNKRIKAWQVWNEPNMESDPNNTTLEIVNSPQNFVAMLALAKSAIKTITPRKKIVSAATTAINQNFPETLDYNKALLAAGIESYVDIMALHFYSERLETILIPGGVGDFVETISKPIWITESGEQGVNNQATYAREFWPFLFGLDSNIKRLYIYQFTEATPAEETFGLRNLTPGFLISDLYIYLRDNALKARR